MGKVNIQSCLNHKFPPIEVKYTEKDVSLYALSIGAGHKSLKFVYEQNSEFAAIPSMGVIFPYEVLLHCIAGIDGLEFNPMMLLHGEQYLEIRNKIPTNGTMVTTAKVNNIYDKGKAALLVIDTLTKDKATGKEIAFNQFSLFIRGLGGFGGDKAPKEKPFTIPKTPADAVSTTKTSEDQALLYRLAGGDLNPLHADPDSAKVGNFEKPILHGLCSFGIATRGILEHFCNNNPERLKSIKVRFSKHVFPGETIKTEMWKMSDNIIHFQSSTLERDGYTLSNGIAEIIPESSSKL